MDEDQTEPHIEMIRYDPPPQLNFLEPLLELVCDGDALEKQGTVTKKLADTKCISLAEEALQNPLNKILITLKITYSTKTTHSLTSSSSSGV